MGKLQKLRRRKIVSHTTGSREPLACEHQIGPRMKAASRLVAAQLARAMWQLRLVVAGVLVAGAPVLANIALAGPYFVDFDTFSPCDDIGSLSVTFDVKLISKDDGTVYKGDLTFPYDIGDEEILTSIKAYRWGSTGGWSSFYNVSEHDILPYMIENFPYLFKAVFGAMGITGKPAPAGTYHIEDFKPKGLKLKNMSSLPYGHYKFVMIQTKDDVDLCCLQFIVDVNEDPSMVVDGKMKSMSHFG